MFKESCLFYLILLSCNVFSSDAYPSSDIIQTGYTTNYTVEIYNYIRGNAEGRRYCNGALIGYTLFLTLASCIMNETYHIQTPNIIQFTSRGMPTILDSNLVKAVYVPRTYNATTLRDDIAVLKLSAFLDVGMAFQTLEIPSKAVEVGGNAKMTTKSLVEYILSNYTNSNIKRYNVTVNVKTIGNEECQKAYPNLVEKGTLCAKFDGTNRPENTSYAYPGSVAVVDGKTVVGLLSRKGDLSKDTDDVQMYADVYSYADFIWNAVKNVTKNMHYCINKFSYDYETKKVHYTCEDSWE